MASKNYINNKEFLESLVAYQKTIEDAIEHNLSKPRVPEYIGECIQKLAFNIAKKPNFSGYSFKEDMIGDGIRNSLLYMHNFNPVHSEKPNPFAYFTTIITYAFIARIESEATETYVKFKSLKNSELYTNHKFESTKHVNLIKSVLNDKTADIITNFEAKQVRKKEKKLLKLAEKNKDLMDTTKPLDKFLTINLEKKED